MRAAFFSIRNYSIFRLRQHLKYSTLALETINKVLVLSASVSMAHMCCWAVEVDQRGSGFGENRPGASAPRAALPTWSSCCHPISSARSPRGPHAPLPSPHPRPATHPPPPLSEMRQTNQRPSERCVTAAPERPPRPMSPLVLRYSCCVHVSLTSEAPGSPAHRSCTHFIFSLRCVCIILQKRKHPPPPPFFSSCLSIKKGLVRKELFLPLLNRFPWNAGPR